ncbi:MAG: hypothetical protein K2M44_02385 [Clostridia bacterium]|nr:hypothetical protein [Clostridia bacterium]
MKAKKTLPIIMFCLGAAALIFALYFTLQPLFRSRISPYEVDISEKVTLEQDSEGDWVFSGKLRNNTDTDQTMIILSIEVKDDNGDEGIIYIIGDDYMEDFEDSVTLATGEEFDLAGYYFEGDYNASYKIKEVNVVLEGFLNLKLYAGGEGRKVAMFMGYVLAVMFIVIGVSNLRYNRKVAAHWNSMTEYAAGAEMSGTFMIGYVGEGKISAKSFGKTLLSSLGAAISAMFVGAGAYKNYMAGSKSEMIVTGEGIYFGKPSNKPEVNVENMRFVTKQDLAAYSIKQGKKQVDLFIGGGKKISVTAIDNALDMEQVAAEFNKLIVTDTANAAQEDTLTEN